MNKINFNWAYFLKLNILYVIIGGTIFSFFCITPNMAFATEAKSSQVEAIALDQIQSQIMELRNRIEELIRQIAIKYRNIDTCNIIDRVIYREQCKDGIKRLETADPAKCNEENNASACWYQLMHNISNYIDETFCTKITATNYIANCYNMAAQNTMDVSLCKKVRKVDMGGCYSNIAAKTINLNECLQIMPDNQGKDQCYLEFIKKDKNLSYCDKITNKKDLSSCYYRYAIYSNDTSVCDKISSSSSLMKEDCYKGNCVFLGDTNRIAECVKARTK